MDKDMYDAGSPVQFNISSSSYRTAAGTPFAEAINRYYGCKIPQLKATSDGRNWQRKFVGDEIMAEFISESDFLYLSGITIGLLMSTGRYGDRSLESEQAFMVFGRGRGCSFLGSTRQIFYLKPEFCDPSAHEPGSNWISNNYRTYGSCVQQSFMDNHTVASNHSCSSTEFQGYVFNSSVGQQSGVKRLKCYEVSCTPQYTLSIKIESIYHSCDQGIAEIVLPSNSSWRVDCPHRPQEYCLNIQCPEFCKSNSFCFAGKCRCYVAQYFDSETGQCQNRDGCAFRLNKYRCTDQETCTGTLNEKKYCLTCRVTGKRDQCTCQKGSYYSGKLLDCTPCPSGDNCSCSNNNQEYFPALSGCGCQVGYYLSKGSCSVCVKGCLICSSLACTECQPNFLLISGACKQCPYHIIDNQCTCAPGSFLQVPKGSLECARCDIVCRICINSARECLLCAQHEFLSACYYCQGENQVFNGVNCVCSVGHTNSSGTCEPCASSCLSCIESSCLACAPHAEGTNVCAVCEANQLFIGTRCVCRPGYFDFAGDCEPCHSNCLLCTNGTACTSCPGLTILDDAGACVGCPANKVHSPVENACICLELNVFGRDCTPCAQNCLRCSSGTQCLACAEGLLLLTGKCLGCPEHSQLVGEACECLPGFYSEGRDCLPCPPLCVSCSSSLCLACDAEHILLDNLCQLRPEFRCPGNAYMTQDNLCADCPPNSFISPGLNQCVHCQDNEQWNAVKLECIHCEKCEQPGQIRISSVLLVNKKMIVTLNATSQQLITPANAVTSNFLFKLLRRGKVEKEFEPLYVQSTKRSFSLVSEELPILETGEYGLGMEIKNLAEGNELLISGLDEVTFQNEAEDNRFLSLAIVVLTMAADVVYLLVGCKYNLLLFGQFIYPWVYTADPATVSFALGFQYLNLNFYNPFQHLFREDYKEVSTPTVYLVGVDANPLRNAGGGLLVAALLWVGFLVLRKRSRRHLLQRYAAAGLAPVLFFSLLQISFLKDNLRKGFLPWVGLALLVLVLGMLITLMLFDSRTMVMVAEEPAETEQVIKNLETRPTLKKEPLFREELPEELRMRFRYEVGISLLLQLVFVLAVLFHTRVVLVLLAVALINCLVVFHTCALPEFWLALLDLGLAATLCFSSSTLLFVEIALYLRVGFVAIRVLLRLNAQYLS